MGSAHAGSCHAGDLVQRDGGWLRLAGGAFPEVYGLCGMQQRVSRKSA